MMKEEFSEDLKGHHHDHDHESCFSDVSPLVESDRARGIRAAKEILSLTDENLNREGLLKTPERFAKAYDHLFSGYKMSPQEAIGEGVFDSEGSGLVSVEDVEFYSMCEHHLLPFWGKAKVIYFPRKKILGLSKIPRLVNLFSRRVQVQERITEQLVHAISELIDPRAIAVQVEAQHLCMMMRGVEKQASSTKTEKITGYDDLQEWERKQLLNILNR